MRPAQKSTTDRRVLRTRQALRGALMGLLAERGWDGVDVQSLCERANVGRSTFYQHYPNKEALLEGSFGDLRSALRQQVPRSGAKLPDRLGFVGGLIEHAHEHRAVFRALLGRRSGHYVQDRFREMLVAMVDEERPLGARRSWQAQALANVLGGALFQLLLWWLAAGRPQRAQDIEALFHELSEPVLRQARRLG